MHRVERSEVEVPRHCQRHHRQYELRHVGRSDDERTATTMNTLSEQFKAARWAGIPLIVIRTADPAMTTRTIVESVANGDPPPILSWNAVDGLSADLLPNMDNPPGRQAMASLKPEVGME